MFKKKKNAASEKRVKEMAQCPCPESVKTEFESQDQCKTQADVVAPVIPVSVQEAGTWNPWDKLASQADQISGCWVQLQE